MLRWISLVLLYATASSVLALLSPIPIEGAYTYEFEDEEAYERFKPSFEGIADVRTHINSTLLRATALQFRDLGSAKAMAEQLAKLPEVKSFHRFHSFSRSEPLNRTSLAEDEISHLLRRDGSDAYKNRPHLMTQVDKLHAKGFYGEKVRIAIVDTGIDYTHPALGGCFGKGCIVSYGMSLVNEVDSTRLAKPSKDPMDCVGHGTRVAGIIAAQEKRNPYGLRGVAPGVELGAFKILGCHGTPDEAVIIEALLAAQGAKSDIINVSFGGEAGWSTSLLSITLTRISQEGTVCVAAAGNEGYYGMWNNIDPASSTDSIAISSFQSEIRPVDRKNIDFEKVKTPKIRWVDNTVNPRLPSEFTTWGPNWDLKVKPDLGAPGDSILVLDMVKNGGYNIVDGTSYAAPLVAGAVALVKVKRKGIKPAEIRNLLITTAKPANFYDLKKVVNMLAPVPQQGGGMLQAHDAAMATAVLDVGSISFGDMHRPRLQQKFSLKNTGQKQLTFETRHRPAATAFTFAPGKTRPKLFPPELSNMYAEIKVQPNKFTVKPGENIELTITASPNKGLDSKRVPVWSGFMELIASDKQVYSLPYMGVAADMSKLSVLSKDGNRVLSGSAYTVIFANEQPMADEETLSELGITPAPKNLKFQLPRQGDRDTRKVLPVFCIDLDMGSSLIWMDLVPVGKFEHKDFPTSTHLGLKSIGILHERTKVKLPRGKYMFAWNGQLHGESGKYVPAGSYKVVTRVLKLFGFEANPNDFETWESPTIHISYAK